MSEEQALLILAANEAGWVRDRTRADAIIAAEVARQRDRERRAEQEEPERWDLCD